VSSSLSILLTFDNFPFNSFIKAGSSYLLPFPPAKGESVFPGTFDTLAFLREAGRGGATSAGMLEVGFLYIFLVLSFLGRLSWLTLL
jgi:hypothetical protein